MNQTEHTPVSARPTVTVVLPVRNEAEFIERSLGAVLRQDYPANLTDIIVADGASDDGTAEIVSKLTNTNPRVRLINNPERIVATGLNRAMAEASGEVIVRVDGHCEIASDYVSRCIEHLRSGADGVGGPVETIGQTPRAHVIATAMSSKFGVGDSAFRTLTDRTLFADTVPFPAYTRTIVERAGAYDAELVRNQDDEYNYRLRKMGARILLAADVRSRYYSRSSLKSLWRQYRQYGYWKVRVLQKHPLQMSARQFIPPMFVAALIVSSAAALVTTHGWILLAGVLASYAVANVTATALVVRGRPLPQPWMLPIAFATLHISYGIGFLTGLLRFWNRWGRASNSGREPAIVKKTLEADEREGGACA
jgi:glycosyltransferase involved in cell wall biosynthesis